MKQKTIISHFNISIMSLLCFFLCMFNSFAMSETTTEKEMSPSVITLLNNQERSIKNIAKNSVILKKNLQTLLLRLKSQATVSRSKFNTIHTVSIDAGTKSSELIIFHQELAHLASELNDMYQPVLKREKQISSYLSQLNILAQNLKNINVPQVSVLLKDVSKLQEDYLGFQTQLQKDIPPIKTLLENIQNARNQFEAAIPSIWLNYYLFDNDELFSPETIQLEIQDFQNTLLAASLYIQTGLPESYSDWVQTILNTLLVCIIGAVLVGASLKGSKALPSVFCNAWVNIAKTSIPWIILGVALYYGAWTSWGIYEIITSLGTLCLCYGQMLLAWQLFSLGKNEHPQRKFPFVSILLVLAISLAIITFLSLPLTKSIVWIIFNIVLIVKLFKTPRFDTAIFRYLIVIAKPILVASILITFAGHVRLAILWTMIYICISIGIYQIIAFLNVFSIASNFLPKEGVKELISGLVAALIVPLALLIAFISPLAWILSFPGGEYLIQNISNFGFNVGEVSFNALQIVSILIFFYFTKSLVSVSCHYIDSSWTSNREHSLSTLSAPIKTTVMVVLWGLFFLYTLNFLGVSMQSLTFIASGLSIGVGLGLKDVVQNIYSGFSLIFGRTIREGDIVSVANTLGTVKKISLRATQVCTFDNAVVFVPNGQFLTSTFTNWTHNGRRVRDSIIVGVAYGSNLEQVMKVALEVAANHKNVLKNPSPSIVFKDFADSALIFEIRYHIDNIDVKSSVATRLRLDLDTAFRSHGIEIPFPQRDIHIHKHDS